MFNVGGGELLVIALIALIVLGPQRLPGAARQAGKVIGDLRRLSSGFQSEMRDALAAADAPAPLAPRTEPDADHTATASVDAAVAAVSDPAPRRRTPLRAAPAGRQPPLSKGPAPRGKRA